MEFELLVKLCRIAITDESFSDADLDISSIDWVKLNRLAGRNKIRALTYLGLSKTPLQEKVPDVVLEKLKSYAFHKAMSNLNQTKELLRILKIFESNNIRAIPYKGVVLAQEAYSNIAAREFSDLDLMVAKEDLEKITELLLVENYIHKNEMAPILLKRFLKTNCEFNFEFYNGEKRIYHIEPHWRVGQKMLELDIDLNTLNEFVSKKDFFGQEIEIFSGDGLLLTTCLHHFGKEQYLALKHVSDIAAIVHKFRPEINWSRILKLSDELKVKNIILFGLMISNHIFDLKLSREITQEIKSANLDSILEAQLIKLRKEKFDESREPVLSTMWFQVRLRNSWLTKFKIIYYHFQQVITPNDSDFSNENLSRWQYYRLYFTKPFRLWGKYVKSS